MGSCTNSLLVIVLAILAINFANCTDFVPVYIWGTTKTSEHIPALHKISEDSFKDTILEYLKKRPYIIIFAEHTLSPEDFAQRNQAGEIAFPNIYNLKESSVVTYRSYVQNPIKAIKQLDNTVTELSIGSLLKHPNVPKDNILIVDLNDAKDDEHRFDMLRRHDSAIVDIYNNILDKHENVLAIYTAHHTSWVAPQVVTRRKSRSLLADPVAEDNHHLWTPEHVILYVSDIATIISEGSNTTINSFAATTAADEHTVNLTLKGTDRSLEFFFYFDTAGYWFLQNVSLSASEVIQTPNVFAPVQFSYHCGNLVLKSVNGSNITLPGFQIQPFLNANGTAFGDAYDCVGFTSVPIWSGLFVTAILLLIMTFGLTMMMDIKTMDRFDDAKGKTITINASE